MSHIHPGRGFVLPLLVGGNLMLSHQSHRPNVDTWHRFPDFCITARPTVRAMTGFLRFLNPIQHCYIGDLPFAFACMYMYVEVIYGRLAMAAKDLTHNEEPAIGRPKIGRWPGPQQNG